MERLIKILFCFLLLFLFYHDTFGVEPENEINAEFDITSTAIIVNWYDTETELQAALDDYEIAGLSDCEWRPEFNMSFCELWLVRPIATDDYYNFDTIGHEFYHALVGMFHNE